MSDDSVIEDPLGVSGGKLHCDIDFDEQEEKLKTYYGHSEDVVDSDTLPLSPSIGSISSSVLKDIREDDYNGEFKDLQIKVDNPEKHVTTMETFITFRVTTKTVNTNYDESEYCVRRRYNDFVWLRKKLVDSHPTRLIPPIPQKHNIRGQLDRYGKEFILQRMALLQKFLNRVAEHPVLSYNDYLKAFLTFKPPEFACIRKEDPNIFRKMSTSFHNLAASYMIKERSEDFQQNLEYVQKLEDKLDNIDKMNNAICKERLECASKLDALFPHFTLWANAEDNISQLLEITSSSLEKCSAAQKTLVASSQNRLSLPLKEYILYCDAVKEAIKRRDLYQVEQELNIEELCKKRKERKELPLQNPSYSWGSLFGRNPEEQRKEKLTKLDTTIDELVQQLESANDNLAVANSDLSGDLENWEFTKEKDIKKILYDFGNRHLQMYEECLLVWEDAIAKIREAPRGEEQVLS